MTTCLNCIRGRFQSTDGEDFSCNLCPIGFISEDSGMTSCTACLLGSDTKEKGSVACIECAPGKFGEGCKLCPVGWKRGDLDLDLGECKRCAKGETSTEGAKSCTECDLGRYGKFRGACDSCPTGWFANEKSAVYCTECKIGEQFVNAQRDCSACDLGKFGSSPGNCAICASGKYQDAKGEESCNPCPIDTYFEEDQATALSQCESCPQDRTTGAAISCNSSAACLCKKEDYFQSDDDATKCLTCPAGAACPIDGSYLMHIHAKPGFWMPSNLTKELVDCGDAFSDLALKELARQRCCPPTISDDPEQKSCSVVPRNIDWTTDDQCERGYR